MREHHDNRTLELVAFGALAAFAAAHWVKLVADPPVGRALLAALAACAGGVVLARLGALRLPRGGSWALAGAVAAAKLALGLLALGLRAGLLAPGGWGELADGIGQGLDGLADADYPYSGQNPWTRLTILLVLPLALGAAAALAFWPGRRQRGGMALLVLIALYAVAVTVRPPPLTLLWGAVLLALIAAWLWLPRLERSSAAAALAALATALVFGLGAAVVLDADDPWLDWTEWRWPGDQPKVDFRWNHSYGPIDWPREGTGLRHERSLLPAPLAGGGTVIGWSGDGWIYLRGNSGRDILKVPAAGGRAIPVLRLPENLKNVDDVRMSPQGPPFVLTVRESLSDIWVADRFDR